MQASTPQTFCPSTLRIANIHCSEAKNEHLVSDPNPPPSAVGLGLTPYLMLTICFTRTSNQRHRLDIVREGGACESRELETRSTLVHDLVHFAVETEARLTRSFYGLSLIHI